MLVIRLNTDRGPSLARLRPTRQEMSIDDVEAAMAHDAALKAHRAARAEREAAISALTSAAADIATDTAAARPPPVHHAPPPPSSPPPRPASDSAISAVAGLSLTESSSSGYTARMSFTSSGATGGGSADDEATPRNSLTLPRPLTVNNSTPSSSSSAAAATSRSTSVASSGLALRVNFTAADDDDDDDDELIRRLIRTSQMSSSGGSNDDEDVDVDDRFVRDIIHAELPHAPDSASSSAQRQQPRRRQRPPPDDPVQSPSTSAAITARPPIPQKPHFVKKSSPNAELLGSALSRRRNSTPSPMLDSYDAGADADLCGFAASLPRSPSHPNFYDDISVQSPIQPRVAAEAHSRSPATFGRRSPPPAASYRDPTWNSNVAKPIPTPKLPRFDDTAQLRHNGDTQFFVEVARF